MGDSKRRDSQQELDRLRAKIDEIDERILKLLNRRAKIARQIGDAKNRMKDGNAGLTVFYRPDRERMIIRRLENDNPGPFPNQSIPAVFKEIISACRSLEVGLQVAYLGPEATFTHLAAQQHFGHRADYHPMRTINEVFDAH